MPSAGSTRSMRSLSLIAGGQKFRIATAEHSPMRVSCVLLPWLDGPLAPSNQRTPLPRCLSVTPSWMHMLKTKRGQVEFSGLSRMAGRTGARHPASPPSAPRQFARLRGVSAGSCLRKTVLKCLEAQWFWGSDVSEIDPSVVSFAAVLQARSLQRQFLPQLLRPMRHPKPNGRTGWLPRYLSGIQWAKNILCSA